MELVDAGRVQADLKGETVLAGVQVRQVARSPLLAGVAALAFDAQGRPYTLSLSAESRAAVGPAVPGAERAAASSPRGQIVLWRGGNVEGPWNPPQVWMDDLEAPRGLLVHEGWFYWLSRGRLLRRRPYDQEIAQTLARAAEEGRAAPALRTRDSRWLEQELLSGLEMRDELPSGGLSLTPQGWLYLSVGSGRHRVRSWDGRQVGVPASGAVLRLRPDGSHLEVWARGLVGPTAATWDSLNNAFLVDAGSNAPFLPRLIQLWQGADYGWRQARAASSESEPTLRPDPLRAADPAQRPGCLPPLLTWRPLEPTTALLWLGDGLDARLHGQLLVADAGQGAVHVFGLEPRPTGTRVAWQFPLLDLRPLGLVPTALAEGPDGALYVAARPARLGPDAGSRQRLRVPRPPLQV
ncbi:MAG: PQQ-dependent sugar dehydrogenase, partial [Firmicutes bacterium]|nr:PQQ-dependent sugar dehydrogenase [Bacillota bacterium]